MTPHELLEILYTALHSEFGSVVETDNLELLRAKLYAVRKDHEDLQILSFVQSPTNPSHLWIVKRHANE